MKTIEISLKEILVYVLRNWWKILIVALIVSGLFAIYSGTNTDYEKELQAYELNLSSKQDEVKMYGAKLLAAETYNNNSILMQIDPYNKQMAQLSFSIDIPDDAFNGFSTEGKAVDLASLKEQATEGIVSHYLLLSYNAPMIDVFSGLVPAEIGETYLRELVTVESTARGVITIRVTGSQDIDPTLLSEAMYAYLNSKESLVSSVARKHRLSLLSKNSYSLVDSELADGQLSQRKLIKEDSDSLTKAQEDLEKLENNEPQNSLLDPKNVTIGLLIGLVLGVLVWAFRYLIQLPIQIPEQIQKQLGIRYLGGVRRKKFLSWGDKLAGNLRMAPEDEAMAMVAASLRELMGDHKKVLITGTVDETAINTFVERLKKTYNQVDVAFIAGADVNEHADTINKLADSDTVLLVEQIQKSKLKRVNQEKERIDMSGKEILGYVLY